jgi:hypothetical protein
MKNKIETFKNINKNMKTLHTYISEKLVLTNKTKIRKTTTCHPDYDKLQKTEPKVDFNNDGICDSFANFLWQFEREGDVLKLDYPDFDHGVDSDNPTEFNPSQLFKKKLEKCGSLHSICHVLNEKWSDEQNCRPDDRWAFYAAISSFYEEEYFEKPYHCEDLEHYIIYNDKQLTNKLLNGGWL